MSPRRSRPHSRNYTSSLHDPFECNRRNGNLEEDVSSDSYSSSNFRTRWTEYNCFQRWCDRLLKCTSDVADVEQGVSTSRTAKTLRVYREY